MALIKVICTALLLFGTHRVAKAAEFGDRIIGDHDSKTGGIAMISTKAKVEKVGAIHRDIGRSFGSILLDRSQVKNKGVDNESRVESDLGDIDSPQTTLIHNANQPAKQEGESARKTIGRSRNRAQRVSTRPERNRTGNTRPDPPLLNIRNTERNNDKNNPSSNNYNRTRFSSRVTVSSSTSETRITPPLLPSRPGRKDWRRRGERRGRTRVGAESRNQNSNEKENVGQGSNERVLKKETNGEKVGKIRQPDVREKLVPTLKPMSERRESSTQINHFEIPALSDGQKSSTEFIGHFQIPVTASISTASTFKNLQLEPPTVPPTKKITISDLVRNRNSARWVKTVSLTNPRITPKSTVHVSRKATNGSVTLNNPTVSLSQHPDINFDTSIFKTTKEPLVTQPTHRSEHLLNTTPSYIEQILRAEPYEYYKPFTLPSAPSSESSEVNLQNNSGLPVTDEPQHLYKENKQRARESPPQKYIEETNEREPGYLNYLWDRQLRSVKYEDSSEDEHVHQHIFESTQDIIGRSSLEDRQRKIFEPREPLHKREKDGLLDTRQQKHKKDDLDLGSSLSYVSFHRPSTSLPPDTKEDSNTQPHPKQHRPTLPNPTRIPGIGKPTQQLWNEEYEIANDQRQIFSDQNAREVQNTKSEITQRGFNNVGGQDLNFGTFDDFLKEHNIIDVPFGLHGPGDFGKINPESHLDESGDRERPEKIIGSGNIQRNRHQNRPQQLHNQQRLAQHHHSQQNKQQHQQLQEQHRQTHQQLQQEQHRQTQHQQLQQEQHRQLQPQHRQTHQHLQKHRQQQHQQTQHQQGQRQRNQHHIHHLQPPQEKPQHHLNFVSSTPTLQTQNNSPQSQGSLKNTPNVQGSSIPNHHSNYPSDSGQSTFPQSQGSISTSNSGPIQSHKNFREGRDSFSTNHKIDTSLNQKAKDTFSSHSLDLTPVDSRTTENNQGFLPQLKNGGNELESPPLPYDNFPPLVSVPPQLRGRPNFSGSSTPSFTSRPSHHSLDFSPSFNTAANLPIFLSPINKPPPFSPSHRPTDTNIFTPSTHPPVSSIHATRESQKDELGSGVASETVVDTQPFVGLDDFHNLVNYELQKLPKEANQFIEPLDDFQSQLHENHQHITAHSPPYIQDSPNQINIPSTHPPAHSFPPINQGHTFEQPLVPVSPSVTELTPINSFSISPAVPENHHIDNDTPLRLKEETRQLRPVSPLPPPPLHPHFTPGNIRTHGAGRPHNNQHNRLPHNNIGTRRPLEGLRGPNFPPVLRRPRVRPHGERSHPQNRPNNIRLPRENTNLQFLPTKVPNRPNIPRPGLIKFRKPKRLRENTGLPRKPHIHPNSFHNNVTPPLVSKPPQSSHFGVFHTPQSPNQRPSSLLVPPPPKHITNQHISLSSQLSPPPQRPQSKHPPRLHPQLQTKLPPPRIPQTNLPPPRIPQTSFPHTQFASVQGPSPQFRQLFPPQLPPLPPPPQITLPQHSDFTHPQQDLRLTSLPPPPFRGNVEPLKHNNPVITSNQLNLEVFRPPRQTVFRHPPQFKDNSNDLSLNNYVDGGFRPSHEVSQPLPAILFTQQSKVSESHAKMLRNMKYGVNGEPLDIWIPIINNDYGISRELPTPHHRHTGISARKDDLLAQETQGRSVGVGKGEEENPEDGTEGGNREVPKETDETKKNGETKETKERELKLEDGSSTISPKSSPRSQ